MHSRSFSVLYRETQQIFSCFGKVFGTRTWAVMSCLRNASLPNAELVLLLGGSGTRLFLTRFKSSLRMLDVMSVNARPFNTYLFWGSRSHRSKTEAYVMTVRSPLPVGSLDLAGSGSESPSRADPPLMEAEYPPPVSEGRLERSSHQTLRFLPCFLQPPPSRGLTCCDLLSPRYTQEFCPSDSLQRDVDNSASARFHVKKHNNVVLTLNSSAFTSCKEF